MNSYMEHHGCSLTAPARDVHTSSIKDRKIGGLRSVAGFLGAICPGVPAKASEEVRRVFENRAQVVRTAS